MSQSQDCCSKNGAARVCIPKTLFFCPPTCSAAKWLLGRLEAFSVGSLIHFARSHNSQLDVGSRRALSNSWGSVPSTRGFLWSSRVNFSFELPNHKDLPLQCQLKRRTPPRYLAGSVELNAQHCWSSALGRCAPTRFPTTRCFQRLQRSIVKIEFPRVCRKVCNERLAIGVMDGAWWHGCERLFLKTRFAPRFVKLCRLRLRFCMQHSQAPSRRSSG